jgi:hypothetical protein
VTYYREFWTEGNKHIADFYATYGEAPNIFAALSEQKFIRRIFKYAADGMILRLHIDDRLK